MKLKSYLQELQETVMPLNGRRFVLHWERRDARLRQQISAVFCADPPDTQIRCKQHESLPAIRAHQKLLAIYCSSMTGDCWERANDGHHGTGPIWWLNLPLVEYSDCVAICCLLYLGEASIPADSFKRIFNTLYMLGMQDEISKIKWSAYPEVALERGDPVAINSDSSHATKARCNLSNSISSSSSSISSEDEVEEDTTARPASKRPRIEGRSKDFNLDEAVLRMFHLVAQRSVKMAELVEALESSYSTVYGHYRELFGKVNSYNRPTINAEMLAKALKVMNEVDSQNPAPHSRVSRIERARRILAAMRSAVNAEQQQQQNTQMRVTPDGDLAVGSDGCAAAGLSGTTIRRAGSGGGASVIPFHGVDTPDDEEAVSMEHHRNSLLVALAQSVMAAAATSFNHRVRLAKEHTGEEGHQFPAASLPFGAHIGNGGSVEHWQAFKCLSNARLMPS